MKKSVDVITPLKPEVYAKDGILFARFIQFAILANVSFNIDFDTGKSVSGEHAIDADGSIIPIEDIPAEHVIQGQQGFRVEVGGLSYNDLESGEEEIYLSLGIAVQAALNLLFNVVKEDRGEEGANLFFGMKK